MFQKSSKHERGNEARRMCPENTPWETEANETKAEIRLGKDDGEQTERHRRERQVSYERADLPPFLAVRVK